ncbi:MAG: hypothetical protein ACLFP4_14590, partial [Spirochaetales bacterium]
MSCEIDQNLQALCNVRAGRTRIIYRVFAALRDTHWGTPLPVVRLIEFSHDAEGCRTVFSADYRPLGYGITSTLAVHTFDDRILVDYEARIHRAVETNRLGLCLLLPATLAGLPFTVQKADNSTPSLFVFPREIAPHHPATDIERLTFAVGDNLAAIRFGGDVFEMEDQRNWTDASYKVYSTPLSRPFPVRRESGETVVQSIEVRLLPLPAVDDRLLEATSLRNPPAASVALRDGKIAGSLPKLGIRLTVAPGADEHGIAEVLPPVDYVRVDASDSNSSLIGDLLLSGVAAQLPGVHLYLWRSSEGETITPSTIPEHHGWVDVTRVLANSRTAEIEAPPGGDQPHALVGTDGAFAELNRSRPTVSADATIVFTVSPQVHDCDDEAVIDNLFGLREVLK